MTFVFAPAVRVAEHARLCLDGLPGAGTLPAALRIARGLAGEGGVIGVVDTQRGAAARHADEHAFLHLPVKSFSPRSMPDIVSAATLAGVDCLIVDSISPYWSGKDGLLTLVDQHRKSPTQSGWHEARPHEQAMMDALLEYPGHVIVIRQVRSDIVVGADETGRPAPMKVALKPDSRDGLEYDLQITASVGLDGALMLTSTCVEGVPGFEIGAVHPKPGEEFGRALAEWLRQGVVLPTLREYVARAQAPDVTSADLLAMKAEVEARDMGGLTIRNERGQVGPLISLITSRGRWVAGREAQAARDAQQPPAPPAEPPAASPDTSSLTPAAPGVPDFVPDDKMLVAEMTLRIAHAPDHDGLNNVEQDLADLKASEGISTGDHGHLYRALAQRRHNLANPLGTHPGEKAST